MKINFLYVIIVILLAAGCEKSEKDSTVPSISCRIKTFKKHTFGTTIYYSYDEKDRLSKITDASFAEKTLIYSPGKLTVNISNGGIGKILVYQLDTFGRVISGNNYTFKYSADGYLIESLKSYGSYYVKLTMSYNQGNLIKVDRIATGPTTTTQDIIDFSYTEHPFLRAGEDSNPLTNDLNTIEPRELSEFLGKSVKNLISKRTTTTTNSTQTSTYNYLKNTNGNITAVDISHGDGKFSFNSISYACK